MTSDYQVRNHSGMPLSTEVGCEPSQAYLVPSGKSRNWKIDERHRWKQVRSSDFV
jgi:hypothetical protein